MGKVSMEELLTHCPSVYKLVVLAAKRAKAIAEGAPKLIEGDFKKAASIALEEIRQGKIVLHEDAKVGEGRKSRVKKDHSKKK